MAMPITISRAVPPYITDLALYQLGAMRIAVYARLLPFLFVRWDTVSRAMPYNTVPLQACIGSRTLFESSPPFSVNYCDGL